VASKQDGFFSNVVFGALSVAGGVANIVTQRASIPRIDLVGSQSASGSFAVVIGLGFIGLGIYFFYKASTTSMPDKDDKKAEQEEE